VKDARVSQGLATLFATVALAGPAQAEAPQLVDSKPLSPRLTELTFTTPALAAPTHVRILTPAGYDPGAAARYPVLYLLHGSFDDYKSWTDKGDAERATAGLPLIVVMPDAGQVGNYVNWFNDGAFGAPEWETYHVDQLIPWVDQHYRTIAARSGRAVAGLSMGGGGAMKYAAAHPDLFVAALSYSGGVDTNNQYVIPVTQASGVGDGSHTPGAIYGLRPTEEIRWRNNNPWDLAENLRGMKLWLVTGDGNAGGPDGGMTYDGVEADVHAQSLAVHQKLDALAIPHVWDDYGPGGHNWFYWTRDLKETLPQLMAAFADPPAAPTQITYTRADPDYSVFGWTVHLERPAIEFSELRDAGAQGFTLRGSGTGTVTTPGFFRAGAPVRATFTSGAGETVKTVTADRDGRLTLTVPLGPGNPYQQYTAQAIATHEKARLIDTPGSGSEGAGGAEVYAARVALAGERPARRPKARHRARAHRR
jgi:S-formylglutathione hydrolase FrmB